MMAKAARRMIDALLARTAVMIDGDEMLAGQDKLDEL